MDGPLGFLLKMNPHGVILVSNEVPFLGESGKLTLHLFHFSLLFRTSLQDGQTLLLQLLVEGIELVRECELLLLEMVALGEDV